MGTVSTQGDQVIRATFDTPAELELAGSPSPASRSATCAGYADGLGVPGAFVVPEIHTTGDTSLYFRIVMRTGYAGPGSYSTQADPGLAGEIVVSINQAMSPVFSVYKSTRGGTGTLTVHPDGSGSFTFSTWGSDESRGTNIAGDLDGTIVWTCR